MKSTHPPRFEIVPLSGGHHAINARGCTVALVMRRGCVDWLLRSPLQEGTRVTSVLREAHLSYTLGIKLELCCPQVGRSGGTKLQEFSYRLEQDGAAIVLVGKGRTRDGKVTSLTEARLSTDSSGSRYEWRLKTTVSNASDAPLAVPQLEFNNVYPSMAYKGILHGSQKEFRSTLMIDRDGVVWRFPHQHTMHYGGKIRDLRFCRQSMAGFFGEPTGAPVVTVHEASCDLTWGICDMYYDLHCQARPPMDLPPGQSLTFEYTVKYLSPGESQQYLAIARPVAVTEEDKARHDCPRLDLGLNTFAQSVRVDQPDEACYFRPAPPQKVWDRQVGHTTRGSLRLTGDGAAPVVWAAAPPIHTLPASCLRLSAMVKTQDVQGTGAFLRLVYHVWNWETLGMTTVRVLESTPVSGTTPGWIKVIVPVLESPAEDVDYLLRLEVVLDGCGICWVTDVDVDLQPTLSKPPAAAKGSSRRQRAPASPLATASASGSY